MKRVMILAFLLPIQVPLFAQGSLHLAAVENDTGKLRQIIRSGADVNLATGAGWTPLMFAAKVGNTRNMEILVSARARVDAVNNQGNTALMVAVMSNKIGAVGVLLRYSADITKKNKKGLDALEIARIMGHEEVLQSLLDYQREGG